MHFRSSLVAVCSCVLLSVAAVSCGEQAQTNANVPAAVQMTGMIQHVSTSDIDTDAPNLTEFLFVSDNLADTPVFLQSTSVTLEKFIDAHVAITGNWAGSGKSILNVLTAEVTLDTNSNLSGTKSFSSPTIGVFFSYPAEWTVDEASSGRIEAKKGSQTMLTIYSVAAAKGETFEHWITRNYADKTPVDYQVGILTGQKIEGTNQDILLVNDNAFYYVLTFTTQAQSLSTNELQRVNSDIQNSLRFFTPGAQNSHGDESTSAENTNSAQETTNMNTNTTQSSAEKAPVVDYILASKETILGANANISQVEVAGKNHVYITYTMDGAPKKMLLEYKAEGSAFTTTQLATFDQGANTTWVKTSGNNVAANEAREVYKIDTAGASKTSTVQSGKNLYTNSQLHFEAQYPRSWYYSGQNISSEGGLQRVTFSDKPLDESPTQQIEVNVFPKTAIDLSTASKTSVGGKDGYVLQGSDGAEKYAVVGTDGRVYVSNAIQDATSKQAVEDLLGSITTQ